MGFLGKWAFRGVLAISPALFTLSSTAASGDCHRGFDGLFRNEFISFEILQARDAGNAVSILLVDDTQKIGCMTTFVEGEAILNAPDQYRGEMRDWIKPRCFCGGFNGFLLDSDIEYRGKWPPRENRLALPESLTFAGTREISKNLVGQSLPIDNQFCIYISPDSGCLSNIIAGNQERYRHFIFAPLQRRDDLYLLDRHPRTLISIEELSRQPIGFGIRISSPSGIEQHQYQEGNFTRSDEDLIPRQPSKLLCRLSHAPSLAPIAIAAFLGLIAGVLLWKAVGHRIERGFLDRRTIGWFTGALGVYALAILLAFVSGQAYKYKTGINRYYCAYQASSNFSV
jgi:hypothetical protein